MKLLFCTCCGDVRKLSYDTRSCECGRVWGRYEPDGAHATVSPFAEVLGVNNQTVRDAVSARVHKDSGFRTLAAWLMGRDAPRVRWDESLPAPSGDADLRALRGFVQTLHGHHEVSSRSFGVAGGLARAAKLTPERRREIAKKAAAERWSKIKKDQA